MVAVTNTTGVPQIWDGYIMRPGKSDVPEAVAALVRGREGYLTEPKRPDLYFLAPFKSCDGYGSQAEDLVLAWESLGVDLTVRYLWALEPFGLQQKTLELLKRPETCIHSVGLCLATAGEFHRLPTEYRVGLTMYETSDPSELYPQWTWQLNELDLLLTPSKWCRDVWRRMSVYTPIKVVELSAGHRFYEVPLWERQDREEFVVVSWAMMTALKSPREMLSVFKKAFPRSEYPNCRFKLKTRSGWCGKAQGEFPQVNDDRIEIIDEDWTFEQLIAFARDADVGMFLSKGEGWGRPGREALALGLPGIIADNTGYESVCRTGFVDAVPTRKVASVPNVYGGEWCVPNWDIAVDALRWHYENPQTASTRAAAGAEWFRRERSPAWAGRQIMDAMQGVTDQPSKRSKVHQTWSGFYGKGGEVDLGPVRHIQEHHKRFFDYVTGAAPKESQLLEVGIGTGSFFAELTARGFDVSAIENDDVVIRAASEILELLEVTPKIVHGDTFNLNGHHADVVYHQGLLEHFTIEEMYKILAQQLSVAERVIFSVPSIYYPTRDFGDENLRELDWWEKVIGRRFQIEHSEYYGGPENRYHVLMDLQRASRGSSGRRL